MLFAEATQPFYPNICVWFERSAKAQAWKRLSYFSQPPEAAAGSLCYCCCCSCTAVNMIAQIMATPPTPASKLSSDESARWGSHRDCFYTISLSADTPVNLRSTRWPRRECLCVLVVEVGGGVMRAFGWEEEGNGLVSQFWVGGGGRWVTCVRVSTAGATEPSLQAQL